LGFISEIKVTSKLRYLSIIGTNVKIILEIKAISDKGFESYIQRTVQEHTRASGFIHAAFEEE
jgi:hypothetical protein